MIPRKDAVITVHPDHISIDFLELKQEITSTLRAIEENPRVVLVEKPIKDSVEIYYSNLYHRSDVVAEVKRLLSNIGMTEILTV